MNHRLFHPAFRRRSGFSLIELLVAMSIIALLAGLSFPVLRSVLQNTAVNTAEGQVNNAISAARVYATRYKPFVTARNVGGSVRTAQDHGDGYSGALVVFTNDNTLRIFENDENAYDPSQSTEWLELMVPPRNGYTPVPEIEDLRFTGRVVALGLVRTGPGPFDVQLVPPPFAIRFDRNGTLSQGLNDSVPGSLLSPRTAVDWDRVVYVSPTGEIETVGSGDNEIVTTRYDIRDDRDQNKFDAGEHGLEGTSRMPDGRVQLPFGILETVSGVVLVQPDEVPGEVNIPASFTSYSGPNPSPTNFSRDRIDVYDEDESTAILSWAQSNGTYARIMLFNRYTGQDLTR